MTYSLSLGSKCHTGSQQSSQQHGRRRLLGAPIFRWTEVNKDGKRENEGEDGVWAIKEGSGSAIRVHLDTSALLEPGQNGPISGSNPYWSETLMTKMPMPEWRHFGYQNLCPIRILPGNSAILAGSTFWVHLQNTRFTEQAFLSEITVDSTPLPPVPNCCDGKKWPHVWNRLFLLQLLQERQRLTTLYYAWWPAAATAVGTRT